MKQIVETLKQKIAEHGFKLLQQNQLLKAMLADLHPHEKQKRFLLELSLRAEIPNKLIDLQNENISVRDTQIITMKFYFKEEYSLEDIAVKTVFDCWTEVLRKKQDTVLDIDGNEYHTVKIGDQEWLIENLKTTRYRNGDPIGTTNQAEKHITNEVEPKYQWAYDGDEDNVIKFGRLYTWYAAVDNRNIAPLGCRVPTNQDWIELMDYLIVNGFNYDGTTNVNNVAKSLAANSNWEISTREGEIGNDLSENNKTGFNALPGGSCYIGGAFDDLGIFGFWWSSDEYNYMMALCQFMNNGGSSVLKFYNSKDCGLSVRCLRC